LQDCYCFFKDTRIKFLARCCIGYLFIQVLTTDESVIWPVT